MAPFCKFCNTSIPPLISHGLGVCACATFPVPAFFFFSFLYFIIFPLSFTPCTSVFFPSFSSRLHRSVPLAATHTHQQPARSQDLHPPAAQGGWRSSLLCHQSPSPSLLGRDLPRGSDEWGVTPEKPVCVSCLVSCMDLAAGCCSLSTGSHPPQSALIHDMRGLHYVMAPHGCWVSSPLLLQGLSSVRLTAEQMKEDAGRFGHLFFFFLIFFF